MIPLNGYPASINNLVLLKFFIDFIYALFYDFHCGLTCGSLRNAIDVCHGLRFYTVHKSPVLRLQKFNRSDVACIVHGVCQKTKSMLARIITDCKNSWHCIAGCSQSSSCSLYKVCVTWYKFWVGPYSLVWPNITCLSLTRRWDDPWSRDRCIRTSLTGRV